MLRLLRAEVRKLVRPLVGGVLLGVVGLVVLIASMSHERTATQYEIAREAVELGTRADNFRCESFGLTPGARCDRARAQLLRDQRLFLRQTTDEAQPVAVTQKHPLGAAGLAAGLVGSLLGAFAVLLIAAAHVAGEWSGGTVKSFFATDGRRGRFVVAKALSVWLAAVVLLLAAWVGLIVFDLVSVRTFELPSSFPGSQPWDYGLPRLGRVLVVLAAFAVIGTLAGVLARSTLAAFLVGSAFIVFSYAAAGLESVVRGTLGYWVGAWMGFKREPFLIDHVWPDTFSGVVRSETDGLVGLVTVVILGSAISLVWMRARD